MLGIVLGGCLGAPAVTLTFNGANAHQVIDGIGANVNYRGWQGTNLQPVLDALMDDAGMTLFRVTHDLSDWEAVNDNEDPNVMNWDYYNGIYSSGEFTRLWDMFAYLNSRGMTDRAFFAFMGWGPQWMMDTNVTVNGVHPQLQPGMEAEWAETIASALLYARNTRGLQFSLVAPNNEPDINFEGVRVASKAQYTNSFRKLADLLDTMGVTNLAFVGPDIARPDFGYDWMPEMMNDSVLMSRVKHFGTHSYNDFGGFTANAVGYVNNSAYADRRVWVTEFNKWCNNCDNGVMPVFEWEYTRGTASHLIYHLLNGASAAMVWEAYDSIYKHHFDAWGFWGLFGVNDTNAAIKTWSPRKHFYTVSQVSKWVRPGARRISVGGSAAPFEPITAFKHDELGQVTIVGVNTAGSSTPLAGTLTGLPAVPELELYYTRANTNLAFGGRVPVATNGTFNITIPGDCVFTLTGFTAKKLTNGVAHASSHAGGGAAPDHFVITVTNPVARVQFEVLHPSADVALRIGKGTPSDGTMPGYFTSDNVGAVSEMVVLRPGDGPKSLEAGPWFLSVVNGSSSPVDYAVKASQWNTSGSPLVVNSFLVMGDEICLTWNALPGAVYVVQGKESVSALDWYDLSPTLTATGTTNSYCVEQPTPFQFFRVVEGVAVNTP